MELEHPWILVSVAGPAANVLQIWRDDYIYFL